MRTSKTEQRRCVSNLVRQHETLFIADKDDNVVDKTMAYPMKIGRLVKWFRQVAIKGERGYSAAVIAVPRPKNAKQIQALLA